jgi:hypothetical protein
VLKVNQLMGRTPLTDRFVSDQGYDAMLQKTRQFCFVPPQQSNQKRVNRLAVSNQTQFGD